jgi:D-glycero-D-manno-heptose 1,7-bisphosphate phosphatase
MQNRAVFLDRDGVINRYSYDAESGTFDSPASPAAFKILPGVGEAIASLNREHVPVIVVSNQPGIAQGKFSTAQLDAVNEEMRVQLAAFGAHLDAALYCRHHPEGLLPGYATACECRKPKPGLLLRAASERNIDLAHSFFIGDGVPDILAGRAARVKTVLIAGFRCTVCEEFAALGAVPDFVARDLNEAVRLIAPLVLSGIHVAWRNNAAQSAKATGSQTHRCILRSQPAPSA